MSFKLAASDEPSAAAPAWTASIADGARHIPKISAPLKALRPGEPRSTRPRRGGPLACGLTLMLIVIGFVAWAQRMENTVVKNGFSVPEYFDPPNETKLKSLLQGAEAEPQSGGLILIRSLKLQTFAETGETQMVVLAPQCVFDTTQHTVNSAGHLEARSGDGQFFLEGEGFLFQQTNLNLIISNRVHTVIRIGPQNAPKQ